MIHRKALNLPPEAVIQSRMEGLRLRRGYLSLAGRILLLAAVCYLLLTQVFLLTQARGNGMFPAVKDGDLLVVFRLQAEYVKDDVIVYTVDGSQSVGRIAARGTDVVTIDESGSLVVNGTVQSGEILYPTYPKEGISYPYRVPEGHVFVLGDCRQQTRDSRDFGPVPLGKVRGKVISVLRRQGL